MSGRRDDGRGGPSAAPPRPPVPPPVRAGGRPTAAPRPVARPALSVPAAAPDASPATPPAPPREADDGGSRRSPWAAVGLVLAAAATVAVFVTENALVLRLALLAVCWAVVGVTFLTGDRRGEPDPAREAELRQVADRAEEQAQWETRLHRDAEEAVRAELAQLRTELATVGRLRDELAGVQQLRTQLGALGQLREEVAALTRLRTELAEVGELRADIGRLRAELTEQLSGELFVERLVMRAQAVRGPLTGDLQTVGSSPTWAPAAPASPPVVAAPRPKSPLEWLGEQSLLGTAERPAVPAPTPSPVVDPSPAPGPRPVPFSRRDWVPDAATRPGHHRRAAEPDEDVPPAAEVRPAPRPGGHAAPEAAAHEPRPAPEPPGHARLSQILADSGVEAPSGRRRRRYRDDDEPDDVLSRLLGRDD